MKKKFAAIILVVVFICSFFTACGKSNYTIVDKALKKTRKLDSISAEMKTEVSVETQGDKVTFSTNANIKANNLKEKNPTVLTDISMNMSNNQVKMQFYQEGKWGYIDISNMKYKTKISENNQYNYLDNIDDLIKDIPEDLLEKSEKEKGTSGNIIIKLKIPNETFKKKYENLINSVSQDTGIFLSDAEVSDAVVKITVKDGYISLYSIQFDLEIKGQNFSRKAKVETSVKYKGMGKKVKITPPKDYKTYEELSLSNVTY